MVGQTQVRNPQTLLIGRLQDSQKAEALEIQAQKYEPDELGWGAATIPFGIWSPRHKEMLATFGLKKVSRLEDIRTALDLSEQNYVLLQAAGFAPAVPMVVPVRAIVDKVLRSRYNIKFSYTIDFRGPLLKLCDGMGGLLQSGSNYLPDRIPELLHQAYGYSFIQLETTVAPFGTDPKQWAITWLPRSEFPRVIAKCDQLCRDKNLIIEFVKGSAADELR